MGALMNRWSFYLSFISLVFVLVVSTNTINDLIMKWVGIHPLEILFYFTLIVLLLGVIGFSGVDSWKSVLRSIFTVGFTLVLAVFLAYIIYVGNLSVT